MELFLSIRHLTEKLCQPLAHEDYGIQSIEDVSPPKWHLAHTSWFFETFLLQPNLKNYQIYNPHFNYLFNSYYQGIGKPYPRAKRGLQARPTVESVYAYRNYVNENMLLLLDETQDPTIRNLLTLGLHHEQQHQELLLMDIKYNYAEDIHNLKFHPKENPSNIVLPLSFTTEAGGLVEIGQKPDAFCFDNECPRHQVYLRPYAIANRLITNGEYLEFIEAGGYSESKWWLADGWDHITRNHWQAPLYWRRGENNDWYEFTLNGLKKLNLAQPVSHVSFYEADAFARFKNARLPTEVEWEHHAAKHIKEIEHSNFLESNFLHPQTATENATQLFGDLWEWTQSAYLAYPGYQSFAGAIGEYNGKFMNNQMVLRGGSCITPASHIRLTYRNFFQPEKRWHFSGIRLAKDVC